MAAPAVAARATAAGLKTGATKATATAALAAGAVRRGRRPYVVKIRRTRLSKGRKEGAQARGCVDFSCPPKSGSPMWLSGRTAVKRSIPRLSAARIFDNRRAVGRQNVGDQLEIVRLPGFSSRD
jgi:hypothetical protein